MQLWEEEVATMNSLHNSSWACPSAKKSPGEKSAMPIEASILSIDEPDSTLMGCGRSGLLLDQAGPML
jgi:hypothetical protein